MAKLNEKQLQNMIKVDNFLNKLLVKGKSNATVKNYRIDMKGLVDFVPEKTFEEMTLDDIDSFIQYLVVEKGMKAASVNRKIASLKHLFKDMYNKKQIEENIMESVEKVAIKDSEKYKPKALTKEEVKLLLETIENSEQYQRQYLSEFLVKRDLLMYSLIISVGLRIEEVLTLTFGQMDFETNEIQIFGKSGGRLVPITNRIKELYQQYVVVRDDLLGLHNDRDIVFISANGNKLTTANSLIRLKKYCELAGMDYIKNHDLRHTFATITLSAGKSIAVVSQILGHSSTDFTYRTYMQRDKKAHEDVCDFVIG